VFYEGVSLPWLGVTGLLVGYVAGMFGVGGGFLLTPMLMYIFGIPAVTAVGAGICQQCGVAAGSFLKYRQLGKGEPLIGFIMIGGSLMGIDAGTRLLSYLNGLGAWRLGHGQTVPAVRVVLDGLFILLLSFTAFYVFRDVWLTRHQTVPRGDKTIPGPLTRIRIPPYMDFPRVQLEHISVPMLTYVGFLLGLASGLMGIGGGVLFTPILLYGIGLSARNAAGTGVSLLLITVIVGTIEQSLRGYVSLTFAMIILAGSSIGAQLGAMTTHRVRNRSLRLVFGCLVMVAIAMIVWDVIRLVRPVGG